MAARRSGRFRAAIEDRNSRVGAPVATWCARGTGLDSRVMSPEVEQLFDDGTAHLATDRSMNDALKTSLAAYEQFLRVSLECRAAEPAEPFAPAEHAHAAMLVSASAMLIDGSVPEVMQTRANELTEAQRLAFAFRGLTPQQTDAFFADLAEGKAKGAGA